MKYISLDPSLHLPPTRDHDNFPDAVPEAREIKLHPEKRVDGVENGILFFVGTATTILEWEGVRILTDPNFLHAGDHVHLGPGVTGTRLTNPAIDLHELPRIDAILLSHYHADHFDQKVEASLRRNIPIITTPHAKSCLTDKGEDSFTNVHALDSFEDMTIDFAERRVDGPTIPSIKVTAMPGKHVPPGPLSVANDILSAVPPTNGWMVELGYGVSHFSFSALDTEEYRFENGYRIYISGDTLMVDELNQIPRRYSGKPVDLMLVHLGGTTIPGPNMPLLMVTMDAKQGVQLMQLIKPNLTIPIHYDDYDVFLSPLEDFKKAAEEAGLGGRVVYLDRKDMYKFNVLNRLRKPGERPEEQATGD